MKYDMYIHDVSECWVHACRPFGTTGNTDSLSITGKVDEAGVPTWLKTFVLPHPLPTHDTLPTHPPLRATTIAESVGTYLIRPGGGDDGE